MGDPVAGLLYDFRRSFLVRLAAAPTTLLKAFGNPRLPEIAAARERCSERFGEAATAVVRTLSELGATGQLAVPRKVQSKLSKCPEDPVTWCRVTEGVRPSLGGPRLDALWEEAQQEATAVVRLDREWEELLGDQTKRERAALRTAVRHPDIHNGIMYSSEGLRPNLQAYMDGKKRFKPSRLSKLEEALATYVGRATAKTAPFSTFTLLGWGDWTDAGPRTCELSLRERRTLVRMQRTALLRLGIEFTRRRPLDRSLLLRVNPTLEVSDGVWRFYRVAPQLTASTLERVPFAEELVSVPRTRAGELLLDRIERAGGAAAVETVLDGTRGPDAQAYLAKMLDLHLVEVVRPMAEDDDDYGGAMGAWLAGAAAPEVASLGESILKAWHELTAYPQAGSATKARIRARVDRHWQDAERALGLERSLQPRLFEDVGVRDRVRLPESLLGSVRQDLRSLGRISALFQPVYEARAGIIDTVRSDFGGDGPLMRVFESYQKRRAQDEDKRAAGREVESLKARVRRAVRGSVHPVADGFSVDWRAVRDQIGELPAWTEPPPSMSFFLQKGRREADPWIMNLQSEGNGRFFSRFLPLFPEALSPIPTDTPCSGRGERSWISGPGSA